MLRRRKFIQHSEISFDIAQKLGLEKKLRSPKS